jgi:hypothetical protein
VLAGPGDNRTAAARSRLRASHAERERAIDALTAAYVQDRLTKDELDERLGEALAAGTYAELATLTASCAARPGAPGLRRRCPCAGYVPPGVSPRPPT